MKFSKKVLLSILATLPLGAISYAAEFESQVDTNNDDLRKEFERRLEAEELPVKYYDFLEKYNILNLEELNAEKNLKHYKRLLEEFEVDTGFGAASVSGTISLGGLY